MSEWPACFACRGLLFEPVTDRWKALGLSLIGSTRLSRRVCGLRGKGLIARPAQLTRYASNQKLARFGSTSGFVLSPLHSLYARGNNMFLALVRAVRAGSILIEYRIFPLRRGIERMRAIGVVERGLVPRHHSLMISNADWFTRYMIFWFPFCPLPVFPVWLEMEEQCHSFGAALVSKSENRILRKSSRRQTVRS